MNHETELIDFALVEHWNTKRLAEMVMENSLCGYTIQGDPYCYTPNDGSNRVNHVVPMAKWGTVR